MTSERRSCRGTITRRGFLQTGATALAVASQTKLSVAGESEVRVGIIGCGVRGGEALLQGLQKLAGVCIVAVCDVHSPALEAAKQRVGGDVLAAADYRQVLSSTNVDAVVIAAPDRHHVPMTLEAIGAGKDVYVEKPLTYSLNESDQINEAVQASDRIVQVGTQQHSMPQFQRAKQLIQDGIVGPVRLVRMWWNRNATPYKKWVYDFRSEDVDWQAFLGNAPDRPFDPYVMKQWRYWWDLGGGTLTDLMIHWLDAASWILDLKLPNGVSTIGDHFATANDREIPDTVQCLMQYQDAGVQASFCSSFVNSYEEAAMELRAEKATIYLDRSRLELHPESKHGLEPIRMILDPTMPRGRGADGKVMDGLTGTELHLANWLDCIRTRNVPNSPVASALPAVNTAHWANRALRQQCTLTPKMS